MTPPLISVDIPALRNDAEAWECVAVQLDRIAEVTADVDAPGSVFRCVTSAQAVANAYAGVLANTREALAAGAGQARLGAGALIEIADAFLADEEAAVSAYESMWEPLES